MYIDSDTVLNLVIVHFVWGLLEARDHLEDLNIDVRKILWETVKAQTWRDTERIHLAQD